MPDDLLALVVRAAPGLFDGRQKDSVLALDAVREPLERWLADPGAGSMPEEVARAAAPLWRWWVVTGRLYAGLRTMTALRGRLVEGDPGWRAVTASLAALEYFAGRLDDLARTAEAGLDGDDAADPGASGLLLLARGWALQASGAADRAEDSVRMAQARFGAAGDVWGRAVALLTVGEIRRGTGDLRGARRAYEESLALYRELADPSAVAACLVNLGLVSRSEGDLDAADDNLTEAVATSEAVGNELFLATGLLGLAAVAADRGQLAQARRTLDRAEEIFTRLGAEPEPADLPLREEVRRALDV